MTLQKFKDWVDNSITQLEDMDRDKFHDGELSAMRAVQERVKTVSDPSIGLVNNQKEDNG